MLSTVTKHVTELRSHWGRCVVVLAARFVRIEGGKEGGSEGGGKGGREGVSMQRHQQSHTHTNAHTYIPYPGSREGRGRCRGAYPSGRDSNSAIKHTN